MARTLKELAQEAIEVQNACNLRGVLRSFVKAMDDLNEHVTGTDALNNHCITSMWADKVKDLARMYNHEIYAEAYAQVKELANGS